MSALRDIRAYCRWCACGSSNEITLCPAAACALHPYRKGKNPKLAGRVKPGSFAPKDPEAAARKRAEAAKFPADLTPLKAVHEKCADCYHMHGSCGASDCPLYAAREKYRRSNSAARSAASDCAAPHRATPTPHRASVAS